jgi:plastocyanin
VRIRRGYVPLAAALGAAVAVLPAVASSETSPTIEAANVGSYSHAWSPSQAAVAAGGVVALRNTTAVRHGVHWVSGPGTPECSGVPVGTTEEAAGTNWSGTCKFAQAGTYTFYCTVHGPEMTGTITVSSTGTTTATTTGTTTTSPTTTTTTTPSESPPGLPLVGGPVLRASQRGGSVRGSLEIGKAGAGGRLEIDVLAKRASLAKAKRSPRVRVGRFVRGSVSAGEVPFVVKLDAAARRALLRHRRLALLVRITLTPSYGEPFTVTRAIVVHT